MTRLRDLSFRIAWLSLLIAGLTILAFGVTATVWHGPNDLPLLRAVGVASIGMGLYGVMITTIAYRRRERWAWFTLWYYPVFWLVHYLGGLPPGQDHVHQVVFILVSLVGLLLPVGEFFPGDADSRA